MYTHTHTPYQGYHDAILGPAAPAAGAAAINHR